MPKKFEQKYRGSDYNSQDTKSETKQNTSSKTATPKADVKEASKFNWGLIWTTVILILIGIPTFWIIMQINQNSQRIKLQTYNNLPEHLKERYYNTLPNHLKAQVNKPIPRPKVQLAQAIFFDPNPPVIPTGFTELGIIPSDGSEVSFTMQQTSKIQMCFTGAKGASASAAKVQSILFAKDNEVFDQEKFIGIATQVSDCKPYPDEISKGSDIRFSWKLPSQDSMRLMQEKGTSREEWPNAILVYQATE